MTAQRRVADAVRRLIESLQVTDLTPDENEALAGRVEAITDDLATRPHRTSWHADASLGLEGAFTEGSATWSAHADRSPVAGALNPAAPPLTFDVVDTEQGQRLHGEVTLSATYEGAPQTVHGGIVSALFDEMLGNAQRVARVAGYTGTITVIFRAPTPTYVPLVLEAWLDRIEGRKILMLGTLHANDVLCAEAEGIFIAPRAAES